MDAWLAYAPVKNNPEDAAKVRILYNILFVSYSGGFSKKKKRMKLLF